MGPAAPLLVERMCRIMGNVHSFVDLGSIWDGFVGDYSRSYMKNPDLIEYTKMLNEKYKRKEDD
jgi:hypothetical protein